MLFPIPFLPWTGRGALEVEIPDDTDEKFRLRAALEIAVGNGASLDGARLDHASLDHASLDHIRNDFWDVLLRAQPEIPALLMALREGRVDGSTYTGDCACLAGTIANARGVKYETLSFADASRPIEQWFLGIRKGDTHKTNQVAKITEGWIVEFQALIGREPRR